MPKNTSQNIDTSNFIPSFFLIAYLCLGFVPNWEAVDKIAPQWLLMSILNTATLGYILYFRNQFSIRITHTLSSALSLHLYWFYWVGGSFLFLCHKHYRGIGKYYQASKRFDDVFSDGDVHL